MGTRTVIGRGHYCKICYMPLRSGNPEICHNCMERKKKNLGKRIIFLKKGDNFHCSNCHQAVIKNIIHPIYYGDDWNVVMGKSTVRTRTPGPPRKWEDLKVPYENKKTQCSRCKEIIFKNYREVPDESLPDELFEI